MVTLLPIECVRGGLKENYAFTSLLLAPSCAIFYGMKYYSTCLVCTRTSWQSRMSYMKCNFRIWPAEMCSFESRRLRRFEGDLIDLKNLRWNFEFEVFSRLNWCLEHFAKWSYRKKSFDKNLALFKQLGKVRIHKICKESSEIG